MTIRGQFILICVLALTGCGDKSVVDVPVPQDLANARFEDGATSWKFAADQSNGKIQSQDGINGSACVALSVAPHHQFACFSQAIAPMNATQLEVSAYVRASGDVKAWLRLECIDPDQSDNLKNYGQLAEAKSAACPTTGQWNLLTTNIQIPARTKHVTIFGYANGTNGIAWFDEFNVIRK